MGRTSRNAALALLMALAGCAGGSEATSAPATQETAAEGAGGEAAGVESVEGFWAEYWSVEGEAQTERYVFLPGGRFGWLAPPDSSAPVIARSGRWALEEGALVLTVQAGKRRGCESMPCDAPEVALSGDELAPLRLTLGECPDNQEARSLDQGYTCRTLGGRTFWRRAGPEGDDPAPFFE